MKTSSSYVHPIHSSDFKTIAHAVVDYFCSEVIPQHLKISTELTIHEIIIKWSFVMHCTHSHREPRFQYDIFTHQRILERTNVIFINGLVTKQLQDTHISWMGR